MYDYITGYRYCGIHEGWSVSVFRFCLNLVHLVYTEHKNGMNFPDDESIAVSEPNLCG